MALRTNARLTLIDMVTPLNVGKFSDEAVNLGGLSPGPTELPCQNKIGFPLIEKADKV
jgi:hypothetical protein